MDEKEKSNAEISNKYNSSKLLLETVKTEYERENERIKTIENRIPILMTVAIFLCGYLFTNSGIDFKNIMEKNDARIYILISLLTLTSLFLVIAILIFIYLLFAKQYKRIELKNFSKLSVQAENEGLIAYDILKAYLEAYEYNQKVNNKKIIFNNVGIVLLIFSFFIFLIIKLVILF
ncbi:hypothetical protein LTX13_002358 [Clostridium perfringens]|nr:hypothetical protein [Clostridium perfringens]MDM0487152.1 hypothetical protein [Clostridium perfringens]MDM0950474.1 hypothetical protein [Clostridium perfringens]MDU2663516.1 hypothetical protein [Clostridium perfringens]HAT4349134.1 hypothetical protein [Clostridium perfringens]